MNYEKENMSDMATYHKFVSARNWAWLQVVLEITLSLLGLGGILCGGHLSGVVFVANTVIWIIFIVYHFASIVLACERLQHKRWDLISWLDPSARKTSFFYED